MVRQGDAGRKRNGDGQAATYLGFDPGSARLGIAVGESVTGSTRALKTVRCRQGQPDWQTLLRLVAEWHPAALVVGRPCHADGSASTSTHLAERFARRLQGRTGRTVYLVDERLSSHEAGRRTGRRRGDAALDAAAAAVILETWLLERDA